LLSLLSDEGKHEDALEIARELEIEYPQEQRIYFALSEIYKSLGRPALQLMAEAEFHSLNGNVDQAVRLYDQVLVLDGVNATTLSKAREKRLQLLERRK
jgi:predicted Zn-dependent protease